MCWHGADWLSLVAILECEMWFLGKGKIGTTFGTGRDFIQCPEGSIEILSRCL